MLAWPVSLEQAVISVLRGEDPARLEAEFDAFEAFLGKVDQRGK